MIRLPVSSTRPVSARLIACLAMAFVAVAALSAVEVDGRIDSGEYPSTQVLAKDLFSISWKVEGDRIFFAIEATSPGWVAIGLDPAQAMARSDMIFGAVGADGKTTAVDAWSTGPFGPHPADTDQGGKSDLLSFAGKRAGDKVVFEFSRLLDTKDGLDKAILLDRPMKIIWATAPDFGFKTKHARRGSAQVAFGGGR